MSKAAFQWTEAAQFCLEEMALAGKTGAQIGNALGITRSAVLGRARRTGVKLPWTKEKASTWGPRLKAPLFEHLSAEELEHFQRISSEIEELYRERRKLVQRAAGRQENAAIRQRRAEGDADRTVI